MAALGKLVNDWALLTEGFDKSAWGWMKALAGDMDIVARIICKYNPLLIWGDALVGFEDAVPFLEAVEADACAYDAGYTCAKEALRIIDYTKKCTSAIVAMDNYLAIDY